MPHPLIQATQKLSKAVDRLQFGETVSYVYNPLDYAGRVHREYLLRYGVPFEEPRTLLVGMNPGPFGMAQTGVPFGAVGMVRSWLDLATSKNGEELKIKSPASTHPKRPISGFACSREEVSGQRLWDWARDEFETPERFFSRFFVTNYCPLLFLHASGRNLTPDKLSADERRSVAEVCDQGLFSIANAINVDRVVGVGVFAEKAAQRVFGKQVPVGRILHPSPASPIANRGWAPVARQQLLDLGAL